MPKAKGADFPNKKIAGEFDGYSAVWSKSTLPVNFLKKLLQLTKECESGSDTSLLMGTAKGNNSGTMAITDH